MLCELHIENMAVIPSASLSLTPGLNVISGETGAGKTILAHAIALLLGTRADSRLIRPGADSASVEAVFDADGIALDELDADLAPAPGEAVAIRRRISRDGRSRAFIGGRGATVALLQNLSGRLLAFSAQHEQRSLMLAERQLELIDEFIGGEQRDRRDEFALLYDRRLDLVSRLEALQLDAESREREIELLSFQLQEIEAAALQEGETESLEAERRQLLNAGELKEACLSLSHAIDSNDADPGLREMLASLSERLQGLARFDDAVDALAARLQDCIFELEDIGREAAGHAGGIVDDAQRLSDVEERLDLIGGLKRKYGPSVEEVIAYSAAAGERLAGMNDDNHDQLRLREELLQVEEELLELALALRRARREAAGHLEAETAACLSGLGFGESGFFVELEETEGEEALTAEMLDRSGADRAEFTVAPNPGMPAKPLKDTASGGELSRIMLAIKSTVSRHSDAVTLVFDEIDAGIGGETGYAVGARLKSLAEKSQIICITHLPQIACFADTHFTVVKDSGDKSVTETSVTRIEGEEVVDELCRMMGSDPADGEARAHAESLMKKAAATV